MLATPEIDFYAAHTTSQWRDYCARHGYHFRLERKRLVPDMHINWSKIELVRRTLAERRYDVVLLIDADTIIADPERRLEALLDDHPGKDLLFCPDTTRRFRLHWPLNFRSVFVCRAWRPPNAGFILMRSGDYARRFFDDWLSLAREGELAKWADVHPRNQNVLWRGLFRRHRSRITVLDREVGRIGVNQALDGISITTDGAFVLHDKRLSRKPLQRPAPAATRPASEDAGNARAHVAN